MTDTITRLLEAAEAEPHASPRLINACRSTRAAIAQQATKPTATDKALSQFVIGVGHGPDAPYPGMIEAFENHYGQSFTDKDWRNETGIFAAAWRLALQEKVAQQAEQVRDPMTLMTDALIMEVAKGWREFDAPGGGNSVVYGACRAVLNKYRDLLAAAPKGGV